LDAAAGRVTLGAIEVRSISHWSPYDPARGVLAVP
jgi:hypothetical protein